MVTDFGRFMYIAATALAIILMEASSGMLLKRAVADINTSID